MRSPRSGVGVILHPRPRIESGAGSSILPFEVRGELRYPKGCAEGQSASGGCRESEGVPVRGMKQNLETTARDWLPQKTRRERGSRGPSGDKG